MSKISLYFTIGDIKRLIEQGLTYKEISSQMKNLHPSAVGLSKRSIRQFCKEHNKTKIAQCQKNQNSF